jgi:carbon storage regulator CsrA
MLTLFRKEGESLLLFLEDGKTITVRLDQTKSNQAKISIDGPESVHIMREELLEKE